MARTLDETEQPPGNALAAWLDWPDAPSPDALPRMLRRDLARAALADGQAALTLALTAPDAGPLGTREASYLAARALLLLGRPAEALAHVESPHGATLSIEATRLQAEAWLALDERERALATVHDLVERQPDAVSAWGACGAVALAAGALDEAAAAFEQARDLSPQTTTAVVGLARVRLAASDPGGALALLEPLAETGGATVQAALAEAHTAAGDHERARALQAGHAARRAAFRADWRARLEAALGADLAPVTPAADPSAGPPGRAAPASAPSAPFGRPAADPPAPAAPPSGPAPRRVPPASATLAPHTARDGDEPYRGEGAEIPAAPAPAVLPPSFAGKGAGGLGLPAVPPPSPDRGEGSAESGGAVLLLSPYGGEGAGGRGVTDADAEPPPSPELAAALKEYFAFDAFRPGQAAVCQAMLDGRDTLAVMPTGAGKSLCFQLPAMLLDGVTVVVSPLVALMKDQIDGLPPPVYERATLVNSSLDAAEILRRVEALGNGQYRLVYVAPERLAQPGLVAALRRAGVARVVVDEAHCVSAWGHDFRPDYLTIGAALQRLGGPPLLAVTATASPAVRADIGEALGRDLAVLQTPLFRPNLHYTVRHLANADAKMNALVELCRAARGSVVVYVNSRDRTEELARVLRRHGVQAAHYHAGLPSDERTAVQDDFMLDRTRVIVATVAFGMGVDKANIRLVVHFSLPESLEAYVQESGRAGRDGRRADCVLLVAPSDKANLTRWLTRERLSLADLRAVYRAVRAQLGDAGSGLVDERGLGSAFDHAEGADTRARVAVSMLERAGLLERLGMVPFEVVVEPPLGAPGAAARARTADRPPPDPRALAADRPPPDPRAERLLRGGRQTYGGLALAALLDLPPGELEPWLLDASEAGGLRYRPKGRGLAVRLGAVPLDSTARLERLLREYAAHQDRRVADIVAYAEQRTCRHARICRHFGQRLDPPCGACDVCTTPAADAAPARAPAAGPPAAAAPSQPPAAAVLACLADAPFALTRKGVTQVLRGSAAAVLGPDRSRHHGALHGLTASVVERTVDCLLAEGYLTRQEIQGRDGREFSVLVRTERGRAGPPPWDAPITPTYGRQPAPWIAPSAPAEYDADRFERLRAWRRQEAAEASIAPFMVFSDATLRALAATPPETLNRDTLPQVPGIGPAKLARYGEALLTLLQPDAAD